MATGKENLDAVVQELATATTALGSRVQDLINQINNTASDGLTGPQTEAVIATLASFVPTLNAMGNVPNPPPVPETAKLPGPFRS